MVTKRKIFDIIPPEQQKQQDTGEVWVKKPTWPKPPSFPKKAPILIVSLIAVTGLLCWIFIEPKAEIEIWPEKQSMDSEFQGTISGELFTAEKTVSQEFSSTGTKLKAEKARGTIQVYNGYSTYAQSLVATTRFVSADGKLFRTPKKVVIPGAHYEKGELIPGTIDIEVMADQPGEEYNIGPSTFSIPGFAGTVRYTAFYARSFEPMAGGMKQEVSQVIPEDLDEAKEIIEAKALEESQTYLESLIPEEYIIMEGAITGKVTEFIPLAEQGQEVDEFSYQAKAETQALVFKKSELRELAITHLQSQIPEEKKLQEDSLNIEYSSKVVDFKKSKLILNLTIRAKIYSPIDENFLKERIKNKNPNEIKNLLKSFPEVEKAQIRLWPLWITRAPRDIERIEIRFNLTVVD